MAITNNDDKSILLVVDSLFLEIAIETMAAASVAMPLTSMVSEQWYYKMLLFELNFDN